MNRDKIPLEAHQVGWLFLYVIGICMTCLMLGTKIAEPTATLLVHPFLLLLMLVWCVLGVTYISCNHWTRNWIYQMSKEAHEERQLHSIIAREAGRGETDGTA